MELDKLRVWALKSSLDGSDYDRETEVTTPHYEDEYQLKVLTGRVRQNHFRSIVCRDRKEISALYNL
jgi:hypothetical protein